MEKFGLGRATADGCEFDAPRVGIYIYRTAGAPVIVHAIANDLIVSLSHRKPQR